jgi:hypothetical protein
MPPIHLAWQNGRNTVFFFVEKICDDERHPQHRQIGCGDWRIMGLVDLDRIRDPKRPKAKSRRLRRGSAGQTNPS